MNRFGLGRLALVVIAIAAPVTAVSLTAGSEADLHGGVTIAAVGDGPGAGAVNADSLADAIVGSNPFRLHRSPAQPQPGAAAPEQPAAPAIAHPSLVLAGVLLGITPSAIIEGFPGVDGARTLRVGEAVAGYRLERVAADRVTVAGPDTTLLLQLRRHP